MTPNPQHNATTQSTGTPPDSPLSRILDGLGAAQPSPDLEARLIRTLRAQPAPAGASPAGATPSDISLASRFQARPSTVPRRWHLPASALATAAILLVAAVVTFHQTHRVRPNTVTPSQDPQGQQASETRIAPQPATSATSASATSHTHPLQARVVTPRRSRDLPTDPSALALLETAAPSHPAASVAVTPEERAFARFVSRHNAVSLAALAPEAEPAHEAASQDEFNAFFPPPPPLSVLNPRHPD